MSNQKELRNSILIESKIISNLEKQKQLVCNLISSNKNRLKYFRFMNNEVKQRVESLEEKIDMLES